MKCSVFMFLWRGFSLPKKHRKLMSVGVWHPKSQTRQRFTDVQIDINRECKQFENKHEKKTYSKCMQLVSHLCHCIQMFILIDRSRLHLLDAKLLVVVGWHSIDIDLLFSTPYCLQNGELPSILHSWKEVHFESITDWVHYERNSLQTVGVGENILVYARTELALVAEWLDIWSAGVDIWPALIAELLADSVSDVFGLIQDHLEQDMVSSCAQLPAFRKKAAGSFAGHMCFQRGFFSRKSASSQNKKISYKSEVDATSVPNEGNPQGR